jgi:ADP-ribose pyrophosphatase YjhB (NUDIX family)
MKPELKIVYAQSPFPTSVVKTIFLAGPTDRGQRPTEWRQQAIQILRDLAFDGHVFVPELEDGQWNGDRDAQFAWEHQALSRADAIVFWVPRDLRHLPGFTTNIEWGLWARSGKVVLGSPEGSPKMDWPERYAREFQVPVVRDLKFALRIAREHIIGSGALREGNDALVPIREWRTKQNAKIEYERPSLTADGVITYREGNDADTQLLLVQRKNEPFKGKWALPGGYVNKGEKTVDAARREVQEETGVEVKNLRLIGVFDRPDRDPRGWVVSHAYFGKVRDPKITAQDDAADARWFTFDEVDTMELAFDHDEIIREVIDAGMF